MIDVHEVSETELKNVSSRGIWDKTGIVDFAKELSVSYPNKVIGMPLESTGTDSKSEGFYNKFYKGAKRIKYINYYCRKYLIEAFKELNVPVDVRTNKNTLLVSLNNHSDNVEADSEPESTSEEEE